MPAPFESDTGGDNNAVMRHILELTLCQPPLNLTQEATGGANNAAMRRILELTLRQPPAAHFGTNLVPVASESDQGGDRWRQ